MLRQTSDRFFTLLSFGAVLLLVLALIIILAPMFYRGGSAILFRGTVEFRKMQYARHDRGDLKALETEIQETNQVRQKIYDMVDRFQHGIDTDQLIDEAKDIYRDYGEALRIQHIKKERFSELRGAAKEIRNLLIDSYESSDQEEIQKNTEEVLAYRDDAQWEGLLPKEYFQQAEEYRETVKTIDLKRRDKYADNLAEVRELLTHLLGPWPGDPKPPLVMDQYGATRWDAVQRDLSHLLWVEEWVEVQPGQPLVKKLVPRAEQFKGTLLEPLFRTLNEKIVDMLNPRTTIYWQYFFDDSTPGYFFGGVGPEIIGTLLLTILPMVIAVPFGIISAAYLVECAGDNLITRIIRTCINTLAGVPSIVFGLFGLAFFILFLFPTLGFSPKDCILSAALTLSLLILPVIIRASEEAIRAVPHTYKEASLALGAGQFGTFVKVTFPAALPGILTGIILSLSRAAGETAPILFTGAIALGPIPNSLFDQTRTLSYGSYNIAVGDRLAMLVPHQQYGMVMTLILIILSLNIIAIVLRSRMAKKLRG
jgi:phosphate transport system permease protein